VTGIEATRQLSRAITSAERGPIVNGGNVAKYLAGGNIGVGHLAAGARIRSDSYATETRRCTSRSPASREMMRCPFS